MTNAMSKLNMSNMETKYSFAKYNNGELVLKKHKIPELKDIARYFKLRISGTKSELISRIEMHYKKTKCAIKIQAMFRGHLVRFSIRLRGCALKQRTLCVNNTDFYSLDPIDEIEYNDFYSYTDKTQFIYGFSVSSLISLFKRSGSITNPYNREKLDLKTMGEIFLLHKLNNILYPIINTETHLTNQAVKPTLSTPISGRTPTQAESTTASVQTNEIVTVASNNIHVINTSDHRANNSSLVMEQNVSVNNNLTPYQQALLEKMNEIQNKSIETRTQELFMEIDRLGNYTQAVWFSNLNIRELVHLYRYLHDIWTYRGQLNTITKSRICSLRDPFYNRNQPIGDLSIDALRKECLNVMEHMVYTGIDVEYQRIGTLHVLSAFTLVSIPARHAMYWLYEGLTY